jgi:Family of unknown function (DUF6353)
MNKVKTVVAPAGSKPARFFAGLAVVGVAATIALTIKATRKADRRLEETGDEESALQVQVKDTWRIYIPAAGVATVTVACILRSNYLSRIRSEALLTAFIVEPYVAAD